MLSGTGFCSACGPQALWSGESCRLLKLACPSSVPTRHLTAFSSPAQGPNSTPLLGFVTSVSTAKLILEEAARLLMLLWRVSLPTNGQCTLQCEQVGADTWTLLEPVSVSSVPRCGCGPQQVCSQLGEYVRGGGGSHVYEAPCWQLQVCSHRIPLGSACSPDPGMSPLVAILVEGNPVHVPRVRKQTFRE